MSRRDRHTTGSKVCWECNKLITASHMPRHLQSKTHLKKAGKTISKKTIKKKKKSSGPPKSFRDLFD
jgi:hypothetical protein